MPVRTLFDPIRTLLEPIRSGCLLEDLAATLAQMLLQRVLEGELLAAVAAGVGLLGQVAGQVTLELVARLGPVRAVRAGERPVAMLGDVVTFQLRVSAEVDVADVTPLRREVLVARLPVDILDEERTGIKLLQFVWVVLFAAFEMVRKPNFNREMKISSELWMGHIAL